MSDEAVVRALTRSALSHLVGRVMKVRGLGMPEAVKTVYASRLYSLINDPRTGLYREGPLYLYDMLNEESQTGGIDIGS